jgi:catecholate siderophore receptor
MISEKARYGNYYRDVRITEPQIASAEAVSIINGSLSLSQAVVTPNELAVYSTETSFDNQTDLTTKFKTGGIKHTLVTGVEADIETSNPTQMTYANVPTQNLLTPNENVNFNTGTMTISSIASASVTTLAGYFVDTIDLDQQWELIGGLRFDNINTGYSNTASALNYTETDNVLNWRAGLIYKLQENASIYFVAGTSTDPSAENLSLTVANTANGSYIPPEQTTSFELGTKWGILNNQLNLTAALFWDEMDNALVEDPLPGYSTYDTDAGTEIAKGFELGMNGYLTKQWEVMAGYTFLRSYYLNFSAPYSASYPLNNGIQVFTNLPLRNAPEDTVNFWTTYDLSEKLQIGAGLDAETDRNAGKFAPDGIIEDVPGYITFSAMVKYNLDKQISLQANGINLGDAYYIDQVHPGHIVPGEGRTVMISTNFKF